MKHRKQFGTSLGDGSKNLFGIVPASLRYIAFNDNGHGTTRTDGGFIPPIVPRKEFFGNCSGVVALYIVRFIRTIRGVNVTHLLYGHAGSVTMRCFMQFMTWFERAEYLRHWVDVSDYIHTECDAIAVCNAIEAVGCG